MVAVDFLTAKAKEIEKNTIEPDDDHLAIMLRAHWNHQVAYFHGGFKEYTNGLWQPIEYKQMLGNVRDFLVTKRRMKVKVTQARISALATIMESDVYVSDKQIMQAQEESKKYIPLRNGLYNLETGLLEAHKPELYLTSQLDFDYDEDAVCPNFMRYMYSTLVFPDGRPDEDLAFLFQQFLGYCMTARTDLKVSGWLVGPPDSGKSTLLNVLRGIMGNMNGTIDFGQLGTNRFLLANIVGKRLITFSEVDDNSAIPVGLFKTLVGNDEMFFEAKGKQGFSARPIGKIFGAGNRMPHFTDTTGATLRRIIYIPLRRSVPQDERISDLEQRLLSEKAGIFNQIMGAYSILKREGKFARSEQSEYERDKYGKENDTAYTFLHETMDFNPDGKVQAQDLYRLYKDWCVENGFKPKNRNKVTRDDWERLLKGKFMSNGRVYWKGIQVKSL